MNTEQSLEDTIWKMDDLRNTIEDLKHEIKTLERDTKPIADAFFKLKEKGLSLIHKNGIWEVKDDCGVLASGFSPLDALERI
jgi:hypothetical protein